MMAREYMERKIIHAIQENAATNQVTGDSMFPNPSSSAAMLASNQGGPLHPPWSNHVPRVSSSHTRNHQQVAVPTKSNNLLNFFSHKIAEYGQAIQNYGWPVFLGRRTRNSSSGRSTSESERDFNENEGPDIEEFEFVENIELDHFDGYIFRSDTEIGHGHNFVCTELQHATWCDFCGNFILGVNKVCLRCTNCRYTCHHKCRRQVTLDCDSSSGDGRNAGKQSRSKNETALDGAQARIITPTKVVYSSGRDIFEEAKAASDSNNCDKTVEDETDSGYQTESSVPSKPQPVSKPSPGERTLTREKLRRSIEAFNQNQHGLSMALGAEGITFQGFIRVMLNLMRPINMSTSTRPPSIYEVLTCKNESGTGTADLEDGEITSFYLPKNTTKVIHISSYTTTQEVISALLNKYRITDNPRKFALYEQSGYQGQKPTMRRLADDEQPLPLCLTWTEKGVEGLDERRFVLQENDAGEILWEAFSIPELENFMKILDREEAEYVDQVKAKYQLMKIQLKQQLKEMDAERLAAASKDTRQPVFV